MRRLIVPLIIFCGLGAFVIYQFYNSEASKDSTFSNQDESTFHIKDAQQIGKIFIADRVGNQALLTLENKTWMYTNLVTQQTFRARPDAMRNLLETIQTIRTRTPVPKPAIDNVVKSMSGQSNKVEIYHKNGTKLRTYYVGREANEGKGTHMMMEGAERPFVVDIPNFIGSVHTRYIVTEQDWRDKAVFRVTPQQLEYIQLEYQDPQQRQHSFKLVRVQDQQFQAEAIGTNAIAPSAELFNNDNAATYFEEFTSLVAEKIIYNKQLRDSIISSRPFLILSYKLQQQTEPTRFRVYSVYNPTADRGDGLPGHREKLQRYYIDLDENNFFLVQHLVFKRFLWGYEFFFRKAPIVLKEDEAQVKGNFQERKEEGQ